MTLTGKMDNSPAAIISYPVTVNGVLTRILETGSGDDVVVFLHGVGSRADRWRPCLERAGWTRRCYAIDFPGHGFAQKGAGLTYSVPAFSDFVAAFIDTLSVPKVRLVGASLGGHVAATVACREPHIIRSLVLVAMTGMFKLEGGVLDGIATRMLDRTKSGIEAKLRKVLNDSSKLTETLIREECMINNSHGASECFEALAEYFRHSINSDTIGDQLKELHRRVPTTVIWGEEDMSVPLKVGRAIAESLADADFWVMKGSGHSPYFEKPIEFQDLLEKAFRK